MNTIYLKVTDPFTKEIHFYKALEYDYEWFFERGFQYRFGVCCQSFTELIMSIQNYPEWSPELSSEAPMGKCPHCDGTGKSPINFD
jgi:hypothetical protein